MLYIGGTRDGKRADVPLKDGIDRCTIPIRQDLEPYSHESLLASPEPFLTEVYVMKGIWKGRRHMFSVMVFNGSDALLDTFLDNNKKEL